MQTIEFEYGNLKDVIEETKRIAGKGLLGGGVESYAEGLDKNIDRKLTESRLPEKNPYENEYVSLAQNTINLKEGQLNQKADEWMKISKNVESYLEFVKGVDEEVKKEFANVSSYYKDFSGVDGFVNWINYMYYSIWGVDIMNSNEVTRKLGDWSKTRWTECDSTIQDIKGWFRVGSGRYIANATSSVMDSAILSLNTLIYGVKTVGHLIAGDYVGAAVNATAAATAYERYKISIINQIFICLDNGRAFFFEEDSIKARFYSNTKSLSDYLNKRDLGGKYINGFATYIGEQIDNRDKMFEVINVIAGIMSGLGGTKSDAGLPRMELSGSNMWNNLLTKTGFIDKTDDVTNATRTITTVADVTDDMTDAGRTIATTIDVADDATKGVVDSIEKARKKLEWHRDNLCLFEGITSSLPEWNTKDMVKTIATRKDSLYNIDKYIYTVPTNEDANIIDYLEGIGGTNKDKLIGRVSDLVEEDANVAGGGSRR